MKLLNGAGQRLGDHQPMEEIFHIQRLFLIPLVHNRSMSRKHQGSSRDEVSSRTTFEKRFLNTANRLKLQSQSANDYDEESVPADEVDADSAPDPALDLNPDHEYDRVDEENQLVDLFESFIVVLTTEMIFTPAGDTCLYCQEDATVTFPFIESANKENPPSTLNGITGTESMPALKKLSKPSTPFAILSQWPMHLDLRPI
jgi:hypothetical protein